jgi:hypothetical protein
MAPKRGGGGGRGGGSGGRRGGRPGRGQGYPQGSFVEFVLYANPGFPLAGGGVSPSWSQIIMLND